MQYFVRLALVLSIAACGGSSGNGGDPMVIPDLDEDGFTIEQGDCDDNNTAMNPLAVDLCDGRDNNCNGDVDEGYDNDNDNISVCQGDCADNDQTSFPGSAELLDGIDNDCDGIPDNHTPTYDDDGDGYAEAQGDCDDDEKFINPDAIEIVFNMDGTPELRDNDCDSQIDEVTPPCEPVAGTTGADNFAKAMDICEKVRGASFLTPTDERSARIMGSFGPSYPPKAGMVQAVLSTGVVALPGEPGYIDPNSGTNLGGTNVHAHPDPNATPISGCAMPDAAEVNDYAELRLELQVPANAQSFSFDFNFMSAEFPEFVCTSFDDTFMVILDSQVYTGNISFDAQGNPVSINVGFFTKCVPGDGTQCTGDEELVGTGYEGGTGGGTGWLTTTSPVQPGEKITLRFIIFDEGDHILDSAVLIDNFRWHLEAIDGPITG